MLFGVISCGNEDLCPLRGQEAIDKEQTYLHRPAGTPAVSQRAYRPQRGRQSGMDLKPKTNNN